MNLVGYGSDSSDNEDEVNQQNGDNDESWDGITKGNYFYKSLQFNYYF